MIPRRRNRNWRTHPHDATAALIDVVFLLLVFFLVTARPRPPEGRMPVDPGAETPVGPVARGSASLLRVTIWPGGYEFTCGGRSRAIGLDGIDAELAAQARYDRDQAVSVSVDPEARQASLAAVLDLCAKYGFGDVRLGIIGG